MIYILPTDSFDETSKFEDFLPFLSLQRIEKLSGYIKERDKYNSASAFMLLRYALISEFSFEDIPVFSFGESQKPYISGLSDVHFNISHCRNAVMCGVDSSEIGVDIQDYENISEDVAEMFLSEEEKTYLSDVQKRDEEIIRLWTLKEAFGKKTGDGIVYDITQTAFSGIQNSDSWQKFNDVSVFSSTRKEYAFSVFADNPLEIIFLEMKEVIEYLSKKG